MQTTIAQALRQATQTLRPITPDARFDAHCLAEHAFGKSQTELRLHANLPLTPSELQGFNTLLKRRATGEPLQYLLGEWEFYGFRYALTTACLIPRPETEALVELGLQCLKTHATPQVLDLCAGTGCVGLSLARLCPNAHIDCIELSPAALACLQQNAASCPNARVLQGDVFTMRPPQHYDLLLCNPPYIPTAELAHLPPEVQREPRMALDGGADGVAFYHAIAERWLPAVHPGGTLLLECGEGQAHTIAALFAPKHCQLHPDFHAILRVVQITA